MTTLYWFVAFICELWIRFYLLEFILHIPIGKLISIYTMIVIEIVFSSVRKLSEY